MKVKIAYSENSNIENAVAELKSKLGSSEARFIIYFASSSYSPKILIPEMNAAFKDIKLIGCTTAGEIISGKMLKNSVVAMALGDDLIEDIKVISIENTSDLSSSLGELESGFDKKLNELEHDKYFGIVLIDGLGGNEENIMDQLGNLTDILFVGGSAGDDLAFKASYLFDNEKILSKGAVIAIVKSKVKFGFIKTQSFKVLDKKLLPTKVDEKNREVIEFNNIPAADYYAGMLNIKEENISDHFMEHPVGLVINNDPYVRSPQQTNGKAIKFYCNIKEGVELNLLQSEDIVKDTELALKNYISQNGPVSALINFNCILRTLELEKKGQCSAYGKLFDFIPTIGFSTYGEEYIGHINQTATMVAFT